MGHTFSDPIILCLISELTIIFYLIFFPLMHLRWIGEWWGLIKIVCSMQHTILYVLLFICEYFLSRI